MIKMSVWYWAWLMSYVHEGAFFFLDYVEGTLEMAGYWQIVWYVDDLKFAPPWLEVDGAVVGCAGEAYIRHEGRWLVVLV